MKDGKEERGTEGKHRQTKKLCNKFSTTFTHKQPTPILLLPFSGCLLL